MAGPLPPFLGNLVVSEEVRARVERLELPFGRYGSDAYGIRKGELAFAFTWLERFSQRYFQVKTTGIEHIPASGRAMLVGNHSGGVAIDAAMVLSVCFFEMEPPRLAQGMAEKFIQRMPGASQLASRMGQFTGLPEHAARLLEDDRLLMVFPEGARGTAKLHHQADDLVRFGTGFMRLALQTKTPIVPFGFVGGGDAMPTVKNLYGLGKKLGIPYVPVTPWLLPVPVPTAFDLHIGEPLVFEGDADDRAEAIDEKVEVVKDAIRGLVHTARGEREERGREATDEAMRRFVKIAAEESRDPKEPS